MKSIENWSSGFREEFFKDYTILYTYIAMEQGQIIPGDKILFVTERFYYFNHTL